MSDKPRATPITETAIGQTLTMLGKNLDAYAQVQAQGTVDQLVDQGKQPYPCR